MTRFDAGKDNYIDLMELKLMMEKLEAPQTHLALKNMIKEVDEDLDNKLSFREVRWGWGWVGNNPMSVEGCKERTIWPAACFNSCVVLMCPLTSSVLLQFLLIFRKAASGELAEDSGLCVLARLSEIDVSTEGVKGAKTFFDAKVRTHILERQLEAPGVSVQNKHKRNANITCLNFFVQNLFSHFSQICIFSVGI